MASDADDGRSERRFERLLDMAPDAIVVIDEDAAITFVNLQTEKIFGYARAELLGRPLEVLIPERFRGGHGGHMARYFAHPVTRPMGSGVRLFGLRKDGTELPIEVSLSPLQTEGRIVVSAAIRDITERLAIEQAAKLVADRFAEELRDARAVAEAASAAKTDFLSSMSHELRTPLNAILGFAQLLRRDKKAPLSARHADRVEQILKGGEHLLRLIDDILDLSRIEAGAVSISVEPVSVAEVLGEVATTLGGVAARGEVSMRIEPLPDRLPMVAADRTRFAQILMNFGSNAIKYNRHGGTVAFAVSATDARVRVVVADTGMGIPFDKQGKLFQAFQRAGQETGTIEGTGIGLLITKRLAELMNGSVGFESTPGKGSKFWVEVPVGENAQPAAPAALPSNRAVVAAHSVLYVEDNPANIAFMRDLVEGLDEVEFLTAPTAEMGIEMARASLPDVIVLDINLPGMSGLEAVETLRALPETREIPVIALTAAATERDKARGLERGFYRYLTKPVKVDELLTALETVLAR